MLPYSLGNDRYADFALSQNPATSTVPHRNTVLSSRLESPRFASIKIDNANLERVLSSRDGQFTVTLHPPCLAHLNVCTAADSLTFSKVSAYSQG